MRRGFDRLAQGYMDGAQVQSEIGHRMLERLDLVRIDPALILDAGSGPGLPALALAARYPNSTVIALDLSWRMLHEIARPGRLVRWFKGTRVQPLCADFEQLPLAKASVDCIISNLALPWSDDIGRTVRQLHGVLKPGGLLMFTSLGPDTLREWRQQGDNPMLSERLLDMHDLGDILVHEGFSGPVMDQEHLRLTYSHPSKFVRDLKRWGALDFGKERLRGLGNRERLEAYATWIQADRAVCATLEVVYGHAWKPSESPAAQRLPDGRSIIRFDRALRKP